jgi:AmmeMemoRadiSam system protein A
MTSAAGDPTDLREDDLAALVGIAERSIRLAVLDGRSWYPDLDELPEPLRRSAATFVTLRRHGRLRGCVGTLTGGEAVAAAVAERARAAAFEDPRFEPLGAEELADLDVSVSVLSPLHRVAVSNYDELLHVVRRGVDGLLVEADGRRGTLLPSVWDEIPDVREFVAALWNKAGLTPGSWPRGIRVSRYTAVDSSGSDA